MDLASLNVDVLLYLMKFVDPVDQFNLVLSGILKGFENVSKKIDPNERIEYFNISLGLRRGSMHDLEIRSMFLRRPINVRKPSHSHLKIFEQLAEDGFLRNNRSLTVFESIPRRTKFFLSVCSMSNLEVLEMHDCKLIFDDLALLFKSCPRLTKLCLNPFKCNKLGWDQDMKNSLKPGFQRLKFFRLEGYVPEDSWSVIQEIFTWLNNCAELHLYNTNHENCTDSIRVPLDGSLKLNSDLVQHLQYLRLGHIPVEMVSWILACALNIHTLILAIDELPNWFHDKIFHLENLKNLDTRIRKTSNLKQFFRNCRQLETLSIHLDHFNLLDFADFEPAENVRKIELSCIFVGDSTFERMLPALQKWRKLCHLTLISWLEPFVPRFEMLCDFIMGMKHLTNLHVTECLDGSNCGELGKLQEKVTEFTSTNRPNFKFEIYYMDV